MDYRPSRFWEKMKEIGYEGSRRTSNVTLSYVADAWAITWLIYGPVGLNEKPARLRTRLLTDLLSVLEQREPGESYDDKHFVWLMRKNQTLVDDVVSATLKLPSLSLSIQAVPARKELAERVKSEVQVFTLGNFLDTLFNRLRYVKA